MPTILLVRHGQASYGAADYDVLSDVGWQQAEVLGVDLARRAIVPDVVIAGGLRRQQGTAEVLARVAGGDGTTVATDARWDEYESDDILAHHSETSVRLEGDEAPPSSVDFQHLLDGALKRWIEAGDGSRARESWPVFAARLRGALDGVVQQLGSGQTALVVSSGGAIGAVCATLLGLPPTGMITFNRVAINTGVTRLVSGSQGVTLLTVNEHGHLDGHVPSLRTYR